MKIRMVEWKFEDELLLCPYVVCESCDLPIVAEDVDPGIVLTQPGLGFPAYHEKCIGEGIVTWRSLPDMITQMQNNSGRRKGSVGT